MIERFADSACLGSDRREIWTELVHGLPSDLDVDALEDERDGMQHSAGRAVYEESVLRACAASRIDNIRSSWRKGLREDRIAMAAARGAVVDLRDGDWFAILTAFGYACTYCGSVREIQKDHEMPLVGGGDHGPWNLVPACRSCNSSKGDAGLAVWCARKGIEYSAVQSRIGKARSRLRGMIGDRALRPSGADDVDWSARANLEPEEDVWPL